jgi:hypothetical protein
MLVRFSRNSHFLGNFSKNTQITNFIKIRPVRDELFHADGQRQTDMKLRVFFESLRTRLKTIVAA